MKKKNPVGAPTKYKEEYNDLALKTIGDEGKTVVQFARDLRVDKATVYRWAERYPEFRDSLTRAKDYSYAYWQDKIGEMVEDRNSNHAMMKILLWTRFGISENSNGASESSKPAPVKVNIVSDNGKSE